MIDLVASCDRLVQFHTIYNNERHVVAVTHLKKRKYLEVKLYKKKEILRGKKLSAPGTFPIKLQDDVNNWKVSLGYDLLKNTFILHINDVPFLAMPYQASVILRGPQNI